MLPDGLHDEREHERREIMGTMDAQFEAAGKNSIRWRSPGGTPLPDIPLLRGAKLKYRLFVPSDSIIVGIFLAIFAFFWNLITGTVLGVCIIDAVGGKGVHWPILLMLVPFLAVGAVLGGGSFWAVGSWLACRRLAVELEQWPLRPGTPIAWFVSLPHRSQISRLGVSLVCTERVQYTQGTQTMTATHEVFRRELHVARDVTCSPAIPLTASGELEIPASGPFSFASDHNALFWCLEVKGEVVHWPDFSPELGLLAVPPETAG